MSFQFFNVLNNVLYSGFCPKQSKIMIDLCIRYSTFIFISNIHLEADLV